MATNLLPWAKAIEATHEAVMAYSRALNTYEASKNPKTFESLKLAYSQLSSAQWELEQVHRRDR